MRGIQFLRIRISVPSGASGYHPCVHKLCLVLMKFLVQGKNKQYPTENGRYIHTGTFNLQLPVSIKSDYH